MEMKKHLKSKYSSHPPHMQTRYSCSQALHACLNAKPLTPSASTLPAGIFDFIDADGSDSIAKAEFLEAVKSKDEKITNFLLESPWLYRLVQSKQIENAFAMLDRDGGGQICFEEFWAFCHTHIINPEEAKDAPRDQTSKDIENIQQQQRNEGKIVQPKKNTNRSF